MTNPIRSSPTGPENDGPRTTGSADTSLPEYSIRIRVGDQTFSGALLTTTAAAAFYARLPMTLTLNERNGNEKYGQLSAGLPVSAHTPGTIQAGDLMLYGATTLVLFYKTFPTTYSYTILGRIAKSTALAAALGRGSVTVTFEPD